MADIEKMVNFQEWAKDKSPLIKTAALEFALCPNDFLEVLEQMKAGERIEGYVPLPTIKEWLTLYRNHRKVYHGFTNSLRQLNDKLSEIIDFYELLMASLNSMRHMTSSELQEAVEKLTFEENREFFEQVKEQSKKIFELIMEDHLDDEEEPEESPDKEEEKRIRKLFQKPEVIFFIRVWLPCFLFYGDYPAFILRKARQGDEKAIEKLLRLDKSTLDDLQISEIFHQAAVAKARGKMSLMTKAIQSVPKNKIDIRRIKYLYGGLLSLISIAMGQKLKAVEIHDLFDAIARDTTGEEVDPDLIETPETFEKRLQRARDFWKIPLPKADKK